MSDPIVRTNFEQLYAQVTELIASGAYRPGDRIGIKEFAARLKVSTTPLREVLSRLVGRGVVEERRSEGYYLARLDARDIADLYRLHGFCTERALAKLSGTISLERGSTDPWMMLDQITVAADDHILTDVRRYLGDRLMPLRRVEVHLFGSPLLEAEAMIALLGDKKFDLLAAYIRRFHGLRQDAAPQISLLLARGISGH